MTFTYTPRGVCSSRMELEIEDGRILSLKVRDGCSGNLQGLSHLVEGMLVEDVIARLDGIRCGRKQTSCPDQLAQALKAYRESQKSA